MKKKLLIICLTFVGAVTYAQTQPTVHNATFNKIAKSSGSDCTCSGWINKDIADQGESSTKDSDDVVKFDNIESDGIYQEVAVEANSDYTLDLDYWYSLDQTSTTHIEVVILKGSGYTSGYTPAYADAASAAQSGFGYADVASVNNTANHIARTTITPPGNTSKNAMSQLSFSTGSETSIAIFVRAVGPYDANSHGDSGKDKGWMNGDAEVRVDNLSLVNKGATASVDSVFGSNFGVYPNPVNNSLNISSQANIDSITIYNVLGKSVLRASSIKNNTLDISNLNKGIYLAKFTSGKASITKRIVKL